MPDSNFKETFPELVEKVVLNVDDNEMNQLVIKQILRNAGIETVSACNGTEAIEKLSEGLKPDFILMDLEMPVMNGIEAAEIIKSDLHSKVPIIINSGLITGIQKWHLKKIGITDYLQKPYSMDAIFSMLSGKLKPNFA